MLIGSVDWIGSRFSVLRLPWRHWSPLRTSGMGIELGTGKRYPYLPYTLGRLALRLRFTLLTAMLWVGTLVWAWVYWAMKGGMCGSCDFRARTDIQDFDSRENTWVYNSCVWVYELKVWKCFRDSIGCWYQRVEAIPSFRTPCHEDAGPDIASHTAIKNPKS